MYIDFEITNTPTNQPKEYFVAYFEGILNIFVDDTLFFNSSGILLLEFAIVIYKWLEKAKIGVCEDFIYETMDYDAPILLFVHVKNNLYSINSIWQKQNIIKLIAAQEIMVAFDEYLKKLQNMLKLTTCIELENILLQCK